MTDQQPTQNAAPRRRRWLGLLLLVSLALNLLVAGAIIAHKLRPEKYRRISGPGYTQIIPRKFFFDVGRDRRAELIEAMRQHRKTFRGHRRDLRASALKIAETLEAEPFDRAALETTLDGYRNQAVEMIDEGGRIGRSFFDLLSPGERKLLAKRIRQKAERRKRKKKKKSK